MLVKSNTKPVEAQFTILANLLEMISSDIPERETFLANALRWSAEGSETHKSGHPILHQLVARIFWKEKNYIMARYHYLHSSDGVGKWSALFFFFRNQSNIFNIFFQAVQGC